MESSNKILTVTYGTFSCSLEGFDDPFTTLQKVAEYFRQLAERDRYFGGVPLVPDIGTLQEIAESTNPNEVDTEIADNGIILRQKAEVEPPEFDLTASPEESIPQMVFSTSARRAPDETEKPEDPVLEQQPEDSVLMLSPDTSVAEPDPQQDAFAAAMPDMDKITHYEEDTSESEDLVDEAEQTAAFEQDEADSRPDAPFMADAASEEDEEPFVDAEPAELNSEAQMIAEKEAVDAERAALDAIAAARRATDPKEAKRLKKAKNRAKKLANEKRRLAELAAKEAASNAERDVQKSPFVSRRRAQDSDADGLAGNNILQLRRTDREGAGRGDAAARAAVAKTLAEIRQNVEKARSEIEHGKDTPAADPVASSELYEPEDVSVEEETQFEELADATIEVETELSVEEPSGSETESFAEVDSDEDAFDDDIEEFEAEDETTADVDVSAASTLSDEEEADLENALSQALVEEETSNEDMIESSNEVDDIAARQKKRRAARRNRAAALLNSSNGSAEDKAVDRLMAATNTKMEDSEQVRRHESLDQLKAAVAATEADAALGDDSLEEIPDELAAYRADLARAQRRSSKSNPSGAPGSSAGSPPPAPSAPLILVSEQRIDSPETETSPEDQPLPMREVAETDGNLAIKSEQSAEIPQSFDGIPGSVFSESTSFADFAGQIGAVELKDMLEAAAAYTSIVEGKPRFSRAQVMSKLAKISVNQAFSKEAGLRSFGRLLREGKILRVQDGQFAISKSSRFSIASRS